MLKPFFKLLPIFLLFMGSWAFLQVIVGPGAGPGLCGEVPAPGSPGIGSDQAGQAEETGFNIGAWFATSVWPHISEVDGQRCPSEPTCSSYSAQAFRKHGFFMGWLMTVDRLIHEADEGRQSRLVKREGQYKVLDPVANNDFWWYGGHENDRK